MDSETPLCQFCNKPINPGELAKVRLTDSGRYLYECRISGCPMKENPPDGF